LPDPKRPPRPGLYNLYEFGGGLVWEFVKTWLRR